MSNRRYNFLPSLCCAAMLGLLSAATPAFAQNTTPATPGGFVYGPYKHLNTGVNPAKPVATTVATQTPTALPDAPRESVLPGAQAVTLAFASGECGQERWKATDALTLPANPTPGQPLTQVPTLDLDAQKVADANVKALHQAKLAYIISTGGEGNVFTCASDAGMERFIQRYLSPSLLGFDFDIESTQTLEAIQSLVARIKVAQAKRPHLRFSFTLPTFAASDASRASLNPLGLQVLEAIRAAGLDQVFINLMVMNYGAATPAACVVKDGRCDMPASALQAAHNLHAVHKVPMAQIELTPMIGVNDVTENIFTLQDALTLARSAKREKLGGLHFWSLDRDTPCPANAKVVSPTCSGLEHPTLAFSRGFDWGLR